MKRIYLIISLLCIILTACGPSPQEVATWTAVAGTIEARLTASASGNSATVTPQPVIPTPAVTQSTPLPTNTLIPTNPPKPSETPFPLGTWQNPAPMGSVFTMEDSTGQFVMTTKLLDIARGEDAVQLAEQVGDGSILDGCIGLVEGGECVGIKVNMILEKAPRGKTWAFMPAMHIALRYRDTVTNSVPDDIYTVGHMTDEQYPPIEWEGWIFYKIQEGDNDLLIYFQTNLATQKEIGILKTGVYFEFNSD